MNQIYLKEHLCEELDGAKEYIKRAIEIKAMAPSWGKMLYEMSIEELKHASYIYKMAEDYYSKISNTYSEIPDYIEECMEEMADMYAEEYACIKKMQELYSR